VVRRVRGPLACCALLVSLTSGALAAGNSEAESAFNDAVHAYDRGAYTDALSGFRHAYALKPSYKLLYNIGLTEVALGDSARALDAFEGYLAGGVPAARASEVHDAIAKLRTKVGELTLAASEAKSAITVDETALPADAALRPIRVNVGEHRVCATKSGTGSTARCQALSVEPESRIALTFPEPASGSGSASASASASVSTAPAQPSDATDGQRGDRRWLAWAAAGAFAAGATVTGVLALGAHSDQKVAEKQQGITRTELDQAQSKTQHLALATDLLLAGAAVSTGVALYLQLSSSRHRSEAPRSSARLILKPSGVDFAFRF